MMLLLAAMAAGPIPAAGFFLALALDLPVAGGAAGLASL